MKKDELIVCLQDTLKMSNTGVLGRKTSASIKSNKVYREGFVSKVATRKEQASIIVHAGTTFETAGQYCEFGKVAVLNFANPKCPGGGVKEGVIAQEECLCRSSNLYPCINNENVFDEYYGYHRSFNNHFYSDRLIYTQNVTVFKSDDVVPQMLPKEEWLSVDVITCAAPYIAKRRYTNLTALLELFKSRIKNIFEAARDNKVDVIVLGAFGCGAFKNPPLIVAEAFKQVICEQNYFAEFKQIVFAIKPTDKNCPNLNTFVCHFGEYAPDAGDRCIILPEVPERRFYRVPAIFDESNLLDEEKFYSWQGNNKYFGKQFSILGDSISTLEGYNPKGYKVFYSGDNCAKTGVSQMRDTWWDKVISYFGGELLINNSWSGSRVTKLPQCERLFPSGCSDERTSSLHINAVKPDVIIVYLGTNDWAFGAKTGNVTRVLEEDEELFVLAYDRMLKKIKSNYPESEIWCCTLSETYISSRPDFAFPHKYAGIHIEEYNEIIRNVVEDNACHLIDLYSYKMPYDSVDGSHPTSEGMSTIAQSVIRTMIERESEIFFRCEKEKRIGPRQRFSVLEDDNSNFHSEYVMLDPDITTILYTNALRLTIESSGKVVEFWKDIVNVGRDFSSDLLLDGKKTVARQQATFFYEKEMWFLRDNFSTNGTWINGARMQPGKKYQLATNDEINFAMAEKVIFNKQENFVQKEVDKDIKAIAFLEASMATFAKSQHKDEVAFKLIATALTEAPLYFPVEIDVEAMLGSIEPTKLKSRDTIQTQKDVKMRIITLTAESGVEIVPIFTSGIEAGKGLSVSIIRYYPQDYLPMLIQMDKPVIINPFSDYKFLLSKELITDVLLPIVKNKAEKPVQTEQKEERQDKYIGTTVAGRYYVSKLLGFGGFYRTYLVKDNKFDKVWAMKVCDKTNRNYNSFVRDAILQETHMMKLRHPLIPLVVDVLENEDSIFVLREYIEGVSLETVVRDSGAQPTEKVIEWAKELCDMLSYLHKLTTPHIYRDMKPANVILMPNQHLKVIDFGIVRMYDLRKDKDTCCLGTKGYAAPEQYGGCRQSDARTDIYGLGMTMHHLVTGVDPKEPPYETKPICQVNPTLPKGLEYIISKCTEINPDDRYQSCDELMNDLNDYMNLPKPKRIFEKLRKKK